MRCSLSWPSTKRSSTSTRQDSRWQALFPNTPGTLASETFADRARSVHVRERGCVGSLPWPDPNLPGLTQGTTSNPPSRDDRLDRTDTRGQRAPSSTPAPSSARTVALGSCFRSRSESRRGWRCVAGCAGKARSGRSRLGSASRFRRSSSSRASGERLGRDAPGG
jgi:hypothetical protein